MSQVQPQQPLSNLEESFLWEMQKRSASHACWGDWLNWPLAKVTTG